MTSAQLINQTSGKTEYYTPPAIVLAAQRLLGEIDLDPASSEKANATIQARRIYSERGLEKPWAGRVWLNHPFSREGNPLWMRKLFCEFNHDHVTEALCITFAATSEQWFKPLLYHPQCFLVPRTNYLLPDGGVLKGVTKGSVVTFLTRGGPRRHAEFARVFEHLGVIKIGILNSASRL